LFLLTSFTSSFCFFWHSGFPLVSLLSHLSPPSSIAFHVDPWVARSRAFRVSASGPVKVSSSETRQKGVGRSPVWLPFSICFGFFCALPH
jgi:hypothetical protein